MSLTSMEEAFKKAGYEQEVNKRETERLKKEQEVTERSFQERQRQRKEELRQDEEIKKKFQPFDDRWRDPKKKKFLIHLIFAYVPAEIPHHPWADAELKEKKCCVCEHPLISHQFILANSEKFFNIQIDQLRRRIAGEEVKIREKFEKEFGNVSLAVVSSKSSAAFCVPCFRAFYEWIERMLLQGNEQINRIIRRRRLESELTAEQLKEYDKISEEKNPAERKRILGEFMERVRKLKEVSLAV